MISAEHRTKKPLPRLTLLTILLFSLSACGGAKKISDTSADYKSAKSLPPLKKPQRLPRAIVLDDSKQAAEQVSLDEANAVSAEPLVRASTVEVKPGVSRLKINAKFAPAWAYLSEQLQQTKITVFARNKDAGRISIGCAELNKEDEISNSGGWSILRRASRKSSDHCALEVSERRGVTTATLLDREGDEIVGDASVKVLEQLSNN